MEPNVEHWTVVGTLELSLVFLATFLAAHMLWNRKRKVRKNCVRFQIGRKFVWLSNAPPKRMCVRACVCVRACGGTDLGPGREGCAQAFSCGRYQVALFNRTSESTQLVCVCVCVCLSVCLSVCVCLCACACVCTCVCCLCASACVAAGCFLHVFTRVPEFKG